MEKPGRGRPKSAAPSKRMGGFRLAGLYAEGFDWLLVEATKKSAGGYGDVTESSVLRTLIREELKRLHWPKAHLLDAPGVATAEPVAERFVEPDAPPRPKRKR